MPICARCFGIYIGNLAAIIFLPWTLALPCSLAVVAVIPTAVDWGIQRWLRYESTNICRVVTGFIGGYGILMLQLNLLFLIKMYIQRLLV